MKNRKKVFILSVLTAFALISCNSKVNQEEQEITGISDIHKDYFAEVKIEEPLINVPDGYILIDGNLVKRENPSINQYGYFKEYSYLYEFIGSDITDYIDTYQKTLVLHKDGEYYYIENMNGKRYYTKASNIVFLPENYVEVDLSDQKLYVFNDDKLVMDVSVITGKPSTPTNEGYTEILEKTYNRPLIGPTWNVDVKYFFPFNKSGEGFHDASWQENFDKDVYLHRGSHGCVNMTLEDVSNLDQYTEVGTKVLVHK